MNFIQRAFKNVTRKYSKSILLVITFFFIGNLVIVGLGISNAAENAKVLTRKKMRAVVTYKVDNDAINEYTNTITDQDELNEFYSNYPNVKIKYVEDLIYDDRISTANAIIQNTFYKTDDFDFVHLGNQYESDMENMKNCYIDSSGKEVCKVFFEPVFMAKGNMFPNMIEFIDGGFEIVEGRFYNQEEIDEGTPVILISKALAETNDLTIGDSFAVYVGDPNSLDKFNNRGVTIDTIKKEFEIVGIFEHPNKITPDASNFNYASPYENFDNLLLMPAKSIYVSTLELQQINFDYYASFNPNDSFYSEDKRPSMDKFGDQSIDNVNFLLKDPLEVDQFVEDYENNLPQFMKLDANNEEFKRLSKPLDTLGLYANFIIGLVVINAVIIISLVTALTLKTREYEIGVLLAIGTSKIKIIGQFFVELALVAILGFTLSVFSGSLIANKVGETVLEYQIQESDVKDNNTIVNNDDFHSIWDSNYSTSISLDDLVSEYNVSISPLIVAEIYILGLGIVFISIIIPSMMIMRFNPKRILMNQN